jgi:ABC-type multidrug transport system fused ATPase/permease subunit
LLAGYLRDHLFEMNLTLEEAKEECGTYDEPTSAMDFENEQEVFSALDTLVKNKTTLTIAHRLSTVKSADRVLVLNDGCIVETGNHRRLYRDNDYYQALCEHSSFAA